MITTKAKAFIWAVLLAAGFGGQRVGGLVAHARQPHPAMRVVGAVFALAFSCAALLAIRWILRQVAATDRVESDEPPFDVAKAIGLARFVPWAVLAVSAIITWVSA